MPLSPNSAIELVKMIRDLYTEAEEIVLTKLARQLARGIESESCADRKYADLQELNRQLSALVDDLNNNVPGAVERAMMLAYNRGVATAVTELQGAGLGAAATAAPPVSPSVAAFTRATMSGLGVMPFRILRWTDDVYSRVTRETTAQVLTGAVSRREASASALKRYAVRGVTGFQDVSGRNWSLASYAEMAARTQAAQASLQGHTDRLQELGMDLVIVSDAPAECRLCRPWEGKVLSISGASSGTLSDGVEVTASVATATAAGLYHANCRHGQTLYLPGITKRFMNTEDPEGDALRQKQRAYERRIREWKRRVIVDDELLGKDSPGARATRAKLRQARAEFKDFRDTNGLKNLAYRESLVAR
ncbi:phage minor capsid protein [Arthrobacter pityocampae]|uniref:phage minor capsid protein n=1 Tax=Arthrobacter pityocampae TaxID=547334 RepID=UPI003734D734